MERTADNTPRCLISKLDRLPSRVLPVDKTECPDFTVQGIDPLKERVNELER